jgi:hypothetical protein
VDGDNWFMYLPKSYCTSVDPNSPNNAKRVFNRYLEFKVNHSISTFEDSWKLMYYWGHEDVVNHNPVARYFNQSGLFSVTTFSENDRTYAFTADPFHSGNPAVFRMVELITPDPMANPPIIGGLRYCTATELGIISASDKLEADGSRLFITKDGSDATFKRRHLKAGDEFYSNGDPKYDTTLQAWGPITIAPDDPIDTSFQLTSDKIIVYHPDRNHLGFHLGALSKTSTPEWLWKTCTTGPLDGKGKFDPFAEYAGWDFTVVGEHILCVYKGEFWKSQGQANQIFHYSTDGAFIRQFGMPKHAVGHEIMNTPGAALNMFTISAVEEDGTIYVYTNDEAGRGIHRWSLPE